MKTSSSRRPRLRAHVESLEQRLCLSAPTPAATLTLPDASWTGTPFVGSAVIADLDLDGRGEILTPVTGSELRAYKLDNAGNLTLFQTYRTGAGGANPAQIKTTPIVLWRGGRILVFAALGRDDPVGSPDDGRIFGWDAVTGNLLPGWPQPTSPPGSTVPENGVLSPLASGDVDGNGELDIVVTSKSNFVTVFRLNGSVMWRYHGNDTFHSGAAVGDIDGDGRAEVVVGGDASQNPFFDAGGYLNILASDGTMKFRNHIDEVVWSSPTLVDLNGDGTLEIVVGTGLNFSDFGSTPEIRQRAQTAGNRIYAFTHDGKPLPGWPYRTTTNDSLRQSTYPSPAAADLDLDGIPEIIATDRRGYLHVIRPNGTAYPGWEGGRLIDSTAQFGDQWASPIVADVTGDGRPEIIASAGFAVVAFDIDGNRTNLNPIGTQGAHLSTPAVGQLDGQGGLELASVSYLLGGNGRPNVLDVYHLPASTLEPPWPMQRRTSSGQAFSYSQVGLNTFIDGLFHGYFDRDPSAGERNLFQVIFNNNVQPPIKVSLDLATHPEARGKVVDRLYQQHLDRLPTPSERQFGIAFLAVNRYRDLGTFLTSSAEYYALAGGASNKAAIVTRLYQTILRETPAPADVAAYVGVLNAGYLTLTQLSTQFLASRTAIRFWLEDFYAAALPGQSVSPETLVAAEYDLARGRREEDILGWVMASRGRFETTHPLVVWLRTMTRDLLGRNTDPHELGYYLSLFHKGIDTRETFAARMVRTDQAREFFIKQEINRLVGRLATPGDIGALLPITSRDAIQARILGGAEYFQRSGNNDNGFLNRLYRDLVDDQNDMPASMRNHYTDRLRTVSREVVALELIQHPFARDRTVVNALFRFLPEEEKGVLRTGYLAGTVPGQPVNPDRGGVSYFTSTLLAGSSVESFFTTLVLTPQYQRRTSYFKGFYKRIGIRTATQEYPR